VNPVYERYLQDEKFRSALVAAARSERAQVVSLLLSRSIDYFFKKREARPPARSPCPKETPCRNPQSRILSVAR
jgi:hypothetical protein